jgi:predicted MFS family arabinose efflux permease
LTGSRLIIQPGANSAVVLAMNVSFFLLLIVLFGLAFLTNWNFHVLMMLVVSALLWGSMIWLVAFSRLSQFADHQVRHRDAKDPSTSRQYAP